MDPGRRPGYTPGMKTAVSIPDELFAEADRLAHEQRKSRSRLYADALREYVARHAPEEVTRRLDDVIAEVGGEIDGWVDDAARRTLGRVDW